MTLALRFFGTSEGALSKPWLPLETEACNLRAERIASAVANSFPFGSSGNGFPGCKSGPNFYCRKSGQLYALCYFDDLLVFGDDSLIEEFTETLSKEVLLKTEGELKAGISVNFFGRVLKHHGDYIDVAMPASNVDNFDTAGTLRLRAKL